MLKNLKFMLLGLLSKLQNYILSNYLTDVFTWISNGHFKFNTSKMNEAQRSSSGSHNKPRLETEVSAFTTFFPLLATNLHTSQQAPHRARHYQGPQDSAAWLVLPWPPAALCRFTSIGPQPVPFLHMLRHRQALRRRHTAHMYLKGHSGTWLAVLKVNQHTLKMASLT